MSLSLSRRQFVSLASAAAGGLLLRPALGTAAEADPFGGFPIGAQSYSLRNFNTVECIRHLKGLGLHYVEFFSKHLSPDASEQQLAEVLQLLKDADIKLAGHGVHGFSKDHDKNRKLFEFAKRAGVKTLTADPAPDSFDSLDKLVEEYQVRIAIHNHGPGHRYNKIADTAKAIKDHHQLIGACVDCGHYLRGEEDPVKAVLELGNRVYAVHVKDDVEIGRGSKNVVIGAGRLDVVSLFKALKQIKFPADGCLSLEYEAKPDNPVEDMRACLTIAKEAIAKAG